MLPKRMLRRCPCLAGLALAGAFVAAPAQAEPTQEPAQATAAQGAPVSEARTRFKRAVELYQDGDLPGALAEFRRADALSPSYRLKYNIGQVCEEQHDYACALRAFRAYLDGGGSEIPHARRASVELDMHKLSALVAQLTVSVDVAGAEILIDDISIGNAPLTQPELVNAGLRRVTARQGALVATRSIEVAGGQDVRLALVLRPELPILASAAASPHGDSPRGAEAAASRELFWLSWVATGVFASATVVSGVMALHDSQQLAAQRQTVPVSADTLAASSSRTAHWALATDIFGLLTLGSAAGALHFTLTPSASPARPRAAVLSVCSHF